MKKITVLIPCYNEADSISALIHGFPKDKLQRYGFELDILVVDNNSSDDTALRALAAGARVITEKRQGKGYAIKTGFYNIADDTAYVAMLDGDGTYKPEELFRLIEPIDAGFCKVIIGSRMHGQIKKGSMKRLNKFGNIMYSSLVRYAFKVTVTDVLTGYYAWSREVIEELRPHIVSKGFAIEMEMITKMARLGYEVYSVPISYDPRIGDSSLNPIADGTRILRMYLRNLRWKPTEPALSIMTPKAEEAIKYRKYLLRKVQAHREDEAVENSPRI
jgi:dolichol-phosphate mannosyltransferase